jgi:enoyl-CoA hydratase/carnithine racemase
MINRMVEPGIAFDVAVQWAKRPATHSASGLRAGRLAINHARQSEVAERAIRDSLEVSRAAFAHPDAGEGADAFLSKRPARFASAGS